MIYLINAPFFSGFKPNLALGLLKALLNAAGVANKVVDLQLVMMDHIGHNNYSAIANYFPYSL